MFHVDLPITDQRPHKPMPQPRQHRQPPPSFLQPLQSGASSGPQPGRTVNISVLADVALAGIDPARTDRPMLPPVAALTGSWSGPQPTGYQSQLHVKHDARPPASRPELRRVNTVSLHSSMMRTVPELAPHNWHANAHRRLVHPIPLISSPMVLRAEHAVPPAYAPTHAPLPSPARSARPPHTPSPPALNWPFVASIPSIAKRVHPPPMTHSQAVQLVQPPAIVPRKRKAQAVIKPLHEQPGTATSEKSWTFINSHVDETAGRRARQDRAAINRSPSAPSSAPEAAAEQLVLLASTPVPIASPVKQERQAWERSGRPEDELPARLAKKREQSGDVPPPASSMQRPPIEQCAHASASLSSHGSLGVDGSCDGDSCDSDGDSDNDDWIGSRSLPSPAKTLPEDVKPRIHSLPTSPAALVSLAAAAAADTDFAHALGDQPEKRLRPRPAAARPAKPTAPSKRRKSYPRRNLEKRKEQNAQAQKKHRTKKKEIAERMRDDLEEQASLIETLKAELGQKERALGEKDTLIASLQTKLHVDT